MTKLLEYALLSVALAFSVLSHGAVVYQEPAGNVYLIEGFEFQGSVYSVTFSYGSFEQAYGGRDNPFPGGLSAGAEALADLLNATQGAVSAGPQGGPGTRYVLVPGFPVFQGMISGGQLGFGLGLCFDPSTWCNFAPYTLNVDDSQNIGGYAWAVFQRVPEPATLALLGLGLTGLALSRRRRH